MLPAGDNFLVNKNMKLILSKQEISQIINKLDGNDNKTYKLSYHMLVQARAEKKLVDLMIRRYEGGVEGDYLTDDPCNNNGGGYDAVIKNYSR